MGKVNKTELEKAISDFKGTMEEYLELEEQLHEKFVELCKLNKVIIMRSRTQFIKERR